MSGHHVLMGSAAFVFLIMITAGPARAESIPSALDLAPPPAAPASVCTASRYLGGPTSCKSTPLWYEYAHQDCVARGYPKVGEIAYVDVCWKGFRAVEFTCCN